MLRPIILSLTALALAGCGSPEPTPQAAPTVEPGTAGPQATEPAVEGGSANCGVIAEEENLGQEHLPPGAALPPDSPHPATSGPHAPSPLPPEPKVHFDPIDEAAAVHNLEHAYVLIYYVAELLDSEVLERLSTLAETNQKVLMAPYDLGPDTALAFVAWTKIQTCGPAVTPEEAEAQAANFILRFAGSENAPEPFGP